jgi:DNA-binding CsgD family transcriptional regulator
MDTIDAATTAASTDLLLGRQRELQAIDDIVSGALDGHGGALLIRGDAGMGKSTLLSIGAQLAEERGARVLAATGVPAESMLPFSGLHRLLRPVCGVMDRIASGQRDAIRRSLGIAAGAAPDLYAVALATLELFAEAAQDAPLLIVVDDAHWLDRSSADVLAFVARRLGSESVAVILSTRCDGVDPVSGAGMRHLELGPLDDQSAHELVDRHCDHLNRTLKELLVREAAGNPLALVELPSTWSAYGEEYFDHPAHALPLNARLEEAFSARLADMPTPTNYLLLAAAADPACSPLELLDVATLTYGSQVTLADAAPAIAAGFLVSKGDGLEFRHTLMRSAVYQSATLVDRVAIHAALAEVLDSDADRSVWHRAASTLGADETVGRDLEAFARRAQSRGAVAVSVAALESSAKFTRGRCRASLLIEAAELACGLGRYALGRRIIGQVASEQLDTRGRVKMAAVRELAGLAAVDRDDRQLALQEAASAARTIDDGELAAEVLWLAASRSWWASAPASQREDIAHTAESLGLDPAEPRLVAILGYATPLTRGARLLQQLDVMRPNRSDLSELQYLASAAFALGDHPRSSTMFAAAATVANAHGQLGLMPRLLVAGGWSTLWTGNLDVVFDEANRAHELGRETGDEVWTGAAQALAAAVWAFRGDYDRCLATITDVQSQTAVMRGRLLLAATQQIRAIGALAVGRFDEAWSQLLRLYDPSDSSFHHDIRYWLLSDIADAAIGAGHIDHARALVAEAEADILKGRWPWCLIGLRYAKAVLAEPEHAESAFREALAEDLSAWPIDHGRLQLAYGLWLSSDGDDAGAREPFRLAQDIFASAGATAWVEKSRSAYRRVGGSSRMATHPATSELSAHELNIARLAASGLTNRQIAQRMFVSHRTIGSHLYRIFPKLGITTRVQLADALRNLAGS